ncbi:MAG: hypothetical protein SP1CHLAM9_08950 [Chlamydiia bacterium]|nr:hypothetical protein [Chlamydiia bacterium]
MPSNSEFQASRYVSYYLLLTKEELMELLPVGFYVLLGKVVEDPVIYRKAVLEQIVSERVCALGFALSKDHFHFIDIPGRGKIAREQLPVIEIKPFAFMITSDKKILENTFGVGSVDFGISLSYPVLFSRDGEVANTKDHFREAQIFKQMRAFVRKKTKPCKMTIHGKEYRASFRVGNNAEALAQEKIETVKDLELCL